MTRRLLLLILLVAPIPALASTFPVNPGLCGDPLGNCYTGPPVYIGPLGTSAPGAEGSMFAVHNVSAGRIGYFERDLPGVVTERALALALHPIVPDYLAAERLSRGRGARIDTGADMGARSVVQDAEQAQNETRWLEERISTVGVKPDREGSTR